MHISEAEVRHLGNFKIILSNLTDIEGGYEYQDNVIGDNITFHVYFPNILTRTIEVQRNRHPNYM